MSSGFSQRFKIYPPQFWLLLFGVLFSFIGTSMVWPFLLIYVGEKLDIDVNLTSRTALLTISAVAMLASSFIVGPIADRFGRKGVMVAGLTATGLSFLFFIPAGTYLAFALLMAARGAFRPLYRIGADAMVADLVPVEQRQDAYALMRMTSNTAVAIGPAIGGVVAERSYAIAFAVAAAGLFLYGLLIAFFTRETLPRVEGSKKVSSLPQPRGLTSYLPVFKDTVFIRFVLYCTLVMMCASLMFTLLPVYALENFGIPESRVSLIITTNAAMVVLLQVVVTRMTKRFPPMAVLTVGALLYGVGVGSVALGSSVASFILSMVVMTSGELILMPTANAVTADLAPVDSRGKYMSIFGMTWGLSSGISPLLGGLLNDQVSPAAVWGGGLLFGLFAALGFALLSRRLITDHCIEN